MQQSLWLDGAHFPQAMAPLCRTGAGRGPSQADMRSVRRLLKSLGISSKSITQSELRAASGNIPGTCRLVLHRVQAERIRSSSVPECHWPRNSDDDDSVLPAQKKTGPKSRRSSSMCVVL